MKITKNISSNPFIQYTVSLFIIIFIIISCNKNKIVKMYSRNLQYSKILYFNKMNKVDSIDFLYKDELYARYLLSDSQIFGYGINSIHNFKNIDEAPIVNIIELEHTYKVNVRFETTSYVLWKFMVSKGSKMINFGSNVSLNLRSFEIPKDTSHLKLMISNSQRIYYYNLYNSLKK